MDDQHLNFAFEHSLSGGYRLCLVDMPSRHAFLPQLAMVYLKHSRQPPGALVAAQESMMNGEVFLLFGQELCGLIFFDLIGVRDAARIHMAFWGGIPRAMKQEAFKASSDLMLDLQDPQIIRIDGFFAEDREDVVKFIEPIGYEYTARISHGALINSEIQAHLYYTYTGV